eukprot:10521693-Alexandrium_andersonii.AAC.1
MSASLVGSEMCIRDSHPELFADATGRTHRHRSSLGTPKGRGRQRDRERAVSYTHLTLPTICSV